MAVGDRREGDGDRRDDGNDWLRQIIDTAIRDTHSKANRRWRKILWSVAIGYLILMLSGGAALFILERRDTDRAEHAAQQLAKAQRTARLADLAFCERINVLRHQVNGTAEAAWATLFTSAERERKLAQTGPNRPTHTRSADALDFIGGHFHHTNSTICEQAVDHPADFVKHTPKPQRFAPDKSPILRKLMTLLGPA